MKVARSRLGEESAGHLPEVIELLYRSGIFKLDRIVEGIVGAVEEQGLLDDSLIIFTADHGEALQAGAPFRWAHAFQLTPEVLHVPLLIRGPKYGVPAGRYSGITRSIDILPTLAGLAGIDPPSDDVAGRDLSAAVRRESEPPELIALSHTSRRDWFWEQYNSYVGFRTLFPTTDEELMWVSARTPDLFFRLHQNLESDWQPEVFDLSNDPLALHSIYDESDRKQQEIIEELQNYQKEMVVKANLSSDREGDMSDNQHDVLRSLGYLE
jgi:arylsulfatase A-like enzyme